MGEISEEQGQICLKSDRVTFLGLVLVADSLIFFFLMEMTSMQRIVLS